MTLVAGCLVALAAAGTWWALQGSGWKGPLRVGFQRYPPFYLLSPDGTAQGMAVDVLNEAARRAGVPLQWTLVPGSLVTALEAGRFDVLATYPSAFVKPRIHITAPWLESEYFLVFLDSRPVPRSGRYDGLVVAVAAPPGSTEHDVARRVLVGARLLDSLPDNDHIQRVCERQADAALIDGRSALAALLKRPAACGDRSLGFVPVPGASREFGIGSTLPASSVADRLRAEIEGMAGDGTLASIHAAWSLTTANEVRIVYAQQRARFRTWVIAFGAGGLVLALAASLWQLRRSRRARRLAEEHARQQERYRVLFERNLAGVYRTTTDGRVLDCNLSFARMLGCRSREEVLGRQAWDFYPDPSVRSEILSRLRREGTVTNQELTLRRADGRLATFLESMSLVEGEGDGSEVCEGTVVDVTRERELEDAYRQAQKLEGIGRLAGGVAHDFNNALTAINGYAELVMNELGESDPSRAMVQEIRKAGQHAASLTQQLLAFSRRQHLQPRVINLNRVVEELHGLLRRLIGENIELAVHLDPALWNVEADPGQMQQVVMNLALNARDAMPGGGRLTISTTNVASRPDGAANLDAIPGDCVRVTCADTGHGMDADTQQQVFEPFFTTKERGAGTGLGLAMVYGIVTQSGGRITVRSVPGEGTTFEIDLPRVDREPAVEESGSPAPVPAGNETILVVEDRDDVRRLVVQTLTRAGYRVLDASRGEEAIDVCRRESGPIHLLLVDLVMPGMAGPAVANALLRLRPRAAVLYMSGYSDSLLPDGDAAEVAYLQKPFTPSQLAAKVHQTLLRSKPSAGV